jgi:hypothetical protein
LNYYTEIGIMGTPVIDPGKTTLYVVAKTITGTGTNAVRNFSLHALDITTGNDLLGGPVIITGTAQSSNGSGTFNPIFQMQRPALLLQNGVVYIGFGGNGCDEYAYNGWLFAYNSQTLQQKAAFLVTPDGNRGSIWQGGSGPAADENGYIYVATANGTYDGPVGGNDFGDSVLKMGWNQDDFGVLDFFTPYNQKQLAQADLDLGSAGPLILPDQPGLYPHELIAGGKQGTLYLVNRDNAGQFNATTDNVIQEIPRAVVSELTGVPSYWNNSVYVAGELDYIKQFSLLNGLLTPQPVSQTPIFFASLGPASTSISANGNSNGILWVVRHGNPALFAFDPTNLANEFYDSTQALKLRDKLGLVARFVTPTISNGKVYVGGTAALQVYGLLPSLKVATGNNQAGGKIHFASAAECGGHHFLCLRFCAAGGHTCDLQGRRSWRGVYAKPAADDECDRSRDLHLSASLQAPSSDHHLLQHGLYRHFVRRNEHGGRSNANAHFFREQPNGGAKYAAGSASGRDGG